MAWSEWKNLGDAFDFVKDNKWVSNGNLTIGKHYIISCNTIGVEKLAITSGANILKSTYCNWGICVLIEATKNTLSFNGSLKGFIAIPLD